MALSAWSWLWGLGLLGATAGVAPAGLDAPVASSGPVVAPTVLQGELLEKGTRQPIADAQLMALAAGLSTQTISGREGHFVLPVPPGESRVEVRAAGYKPFVVTEHLAAGDHLMVRYLLERTQYADYETRVIAKRDRTEVARTSLRGRELTQVPGTFGDPFRVVTTLPGVGQLMSLLGYPIVRGTSPGNTGFMLDGVPVPQLFHLLAGPSVIHPAFIDRVDFYPGNFPVRYGSYVGGIVDGVTRRASTTEQRLDVDLDLLQAGVFARGPLTDTVSGTLSGRYGYPKIVLGLLNTPLRVDYWDYQGRLDGTLGAGRFKIFSFGSFDQIDVTPRGQDVAQLAFRQQFHRLDLGYQLGGPAAYGTYGVALAWDGTANGNVATDSSTSSVSKLRTLALLPRARWGLQLGAALSLSAGVDLAIQQFVANLNVLVATDSGTRLAPVEVRSRYTSGGAFVEMPWWLTENFLLVPGSRFDVYHNSATDIAGGVPAEVYTGSQTTQLAADPRLGWRWRLAQGEQGDVWLKGGVGRYHQPARPAIPMPGVSEIGLERGLLAGWQTSLGGELPLGAGLDVDVQGYFNYLDNLFFDLAVNASGSADLNGVGSVSRTQRGRSYGVEVLLRQREMTDVFGWVSYTLSRSERNRHDNWLLFDFDRPHMLHAVLGVRLPRNWQVGGQVQVQSGRPVSSNHGYNDARTTPFYRIDLRIDKRAVWNSWLLDFYVELLNLTLSPEPLAGAGADTAAVRYILPVVGFRGVL